MLANRHSYRRCFGLCKTGERARQGSSKRGNSTYLVDTVIPMLPHALSNGLCSLVEAQDRLTKSVFITFNEKAGVENIDYARTVIQSNKRLTYAQALAFLKNDNLSEVSQTPLPPKHQTGSTGRALTNSTKKSCSNFSLECASSGRLPKSFERDALSPARSTWR